MFAAQDLNLKSLKKQSTLSADKKILAEEDISRVNDKFLEDIEFVYEEAMSKHVGTVFDYIC